MALAIGAIAFSGSSFAAKAAVGVKSAVAGETRVCVPVTLALGSGEKVGGLQFDLAFDGKALELAEVAPGPAAKAASKDVFSSPLSSGRVRVLIAGLNQHTIGEGVVANAYFDVAARVAAGDQAIAVKGVVLSDPFGNAVPVQAIQGGVTIGVGTEPESSKTEPARAGCFGGLSGEGDGRGMLALITGLAAMLVVMGRRSVGPARRLAARSR